MPAPQTPQDPTAPPALRQGPRPLPVHMALEAWTTQLCLIGLTLSNGGSLNSKDSRPFQALLHRALAESQNPAARPTDLDPVRLTTHLAAAAQARMERFVAGVHRYHAQPSSSPPPMPPPVWRAGSACLRDYTPGGGGPSVLVVPSLINRSTILDLSLDRSLLRSMAAAGLHVYLLDWGWPGDFERDFAVGDYVTQILIPAVVDVHRRAHAPIRVVGYCLGGTLAVAPAVLAPQMVDGLALLAAPWDFHADNAGPRAALELMRPIIEVVIGALGEAPVDLLQLLFAALDATLVGRKFRRFESLAPESDEAKRFVALEDWLNDGVPLVTAVARQVLFSWYGENAPMRRAWAVAGTTIDPTRIACPTLALIPSQDRIVPPDSAEVLAAAIPSAVARRVPLGHIGMIAGGSAVQRVYAPLIAWLKDPGLGMRGR